MRKVLYLSLDNCSMTWLVESNKGKGIRKRVAAGAGFGGGGAGKPFVDAGIGEEDEAAVAGRDGPGDICRYGEKDGDGTEKGVCDRRAVAEVIVDGGEDIGGLGVGVIGLDDTGEGEMHGRGQAGAKGVGLGAGFVDVSHRQASGG